MILILSQDSWELTTEEVQNWIDALGGDWVRLNGEDLNTSACLSLLADDGGPRLCISIDGDLVDLSKVGVVWMRRWHRYRNFCCLNQVDDTALAYGMRQHLIDELRSLTHAFDVMLSGIPSLTSLGKRRVNKWESLLLARQAGLEVPATLVTNNKRDVHQFKQRYRRIITKSISDATTFHHDDHDYYMYTLELHQDTIDRAPDHFFPSLVQELIVKEFDVRTFYLAGDCYSMAIFSQRDEQTSLDFRQYNDKCPNRFVPYCLPPGLESKVRGFMEASSLITGSLDFVCTPDGRHVFLEVNPVGQFRMVSDPCNYRLEKRVAEFLVGVDRDGR